MLHGEAFCSEEVTFNISVTCITLWTPFCFLIHRQLFQRRFISNFAKGYSSLLSTDLSLHSQQSRKMEALSLLGSLLPLSSLYSSMPVLQPSASDLTLMNCSDVKVKARQVWVWLKDFLLYSSITRSDRYYFLILAFNPVYFLSQDDFTVSWGCIMCHYMMPLLRI